MKVGIEGLLKSQPERCLKPFGLAGSQMILAGRVSVELWEPKQLVVSGGVGRSQESQYRKQRVLFPDLLRIGKEKGGRDLRSRPLWDKAFSLCSDIPRSTAALLLGQRLTLSFHSPLPA